MIGIIGALDYELDSLLAVLVDCEETVISSITFTRGKILNREVVIAKCGIGKVAAALCAQTLIICYKPDLIINTGVAGGLNRQLQVYDLIIAQDLVQHDMDVTALGAEPGMIPGLDIVSIACTKDLTESFCSCAKQLNLPFYRGRIVSGDQFIADGAKASALAENFQALACEMEGAAIAQVCYINNLPFIVIRCISDLADEHSDNDYYSFCRRAADISVSLLLSYLGKEEVLG